MAYSSSEWMAIYGDEEVEDTSDFLKQWGFKQTWCQRCNVVLEDNQDILIQCSKCKNAYYCSSKCFNADIEVHQKQCATGELDRDISCSSFRRRKILPEAEAAGKVKQQTVEARKQNPPKSAKKKSKPKNEEKEMGPKKKSSLKRNLKEKGKSLPKEEKDPCVEQRDNRDKEMGLEIMVGEERPTDEEDHLQLSNLGEERPADEEDPIHLSNIEAIACEECESVDALQSLDTTIPFAVSAKGDANNDETELLAAAREALTAENISRMLLRLPPGKIFPCRCASAACTRVHTQRIDDVKSSKRQATPPTRLPTLCPDCSASLCWPESEINGTGSTLQTECPACATIVTVPRIQIQDATHENAPKKPSRASKYEMSSPSRLPKPPARLPSMCPDCSAGLCWPESEINGTGSTLQSECPECATIVTVPRIQIQDATHESAPKKPLRASKDEMSSPSRPPKPPARLPSMCPDCSAGLCWPASEINGTGPTLQTECPDCSTIVIVPRIQAEDATHENAPKKPSRASKDEISPPSKLPKPPARLMSMCPDCSVGLCWPESEINGTGPTLRTECPSCAAVVMMPRIHIQDATHENAPKKPSLVSDNTAVARSPPKRPARLMSMCPDCSAGLCWPESEINGTGPTLRTECPDCAKIVTVPRIQILDATHENAPKKPSHASKYEMSFPSKPPKPPPRLMSVCPDCSAGLCWPQSEINGTGPTLQTECPECATIVTVPRIQIEDSTHENAPKKPSRIGIDSLPSRPPKPPARLPSMCPDCSVGLCWPESEINGTGSTLQTECPECATIVTVPRIQIQDATHENAPKKPLRASKDEMSSSSKPPKPPARLPSMCPDCSAGLCWPESEINGTGPTLRTECPSCAAVVMMPRIHIQDATHENAPKKPSLVSDNTAVARSPPKRPARLMSMCPDCSAGLCWPESEINGTGSTLQTECPECATIVTVPRIQIEDATHENAPKKPLRASKYEMSFPSRPPARLPCTCPSCRADICWHDCDIQGTGATLHTVCPKCASIIVVPRIQINDATHLNSLKKPSRVATDMASPRSPPKPPARLPSMCPSCSAGLCWRHSDMNSTEPTVRTVCPECDSNIIVPRIQINDATHKNSPKKPSRECSDETVQLPVKCLECNADLYWPESEINGSGPTLQVVCAECAAIITMSRISNSGSINDNAPTKPCKCLEHNCCPIIKDGGTVATHPESLTEESIYSESPRSSSRASQNNGPASPLKIGDIVGPRPQANPCRCSVHGGDCPHVLLAEAKARGGPPRMPVRCGGCEGFMTWPRDTIGKAKPFADNTKLRGEDLTGCTLQVPYRSDRSQHDSLTESEDTESSEELKPILEFTLKSTSHESDNEESSRYRGETSRQWTLGVRKLNYSPGTREYEPDTASQASTSHISIDLKTAEIQKHQLLSYRPEWATNPQLRRMPSPNQASRLPGKDQPEWTKVANMKQKNFIEVLQSDGVEKKKNVLPSTPEWVINPPIKKRTSNRRILPHI